MQEVEPGTYFWCSCGKSATQPFCDGAHKGTGFSPVKEVVLEKKKIFWCMCKETKNAPHCDGSHK
jgi:CDGSH-type Zn-finger protein